MDFSISEEQAAIVDNVDRLCAGFNDDYWRDRDTTGDFPFEFNRTIADAGYLVITMHEEYGGAGLGVAEAALMMHAVARSPGAMTACSSIHINIFGPHPIVVFGNEEQSGRWLPDLVAGNVFSCFGVTEPDAGLNTTQIRTRADRCGKGYVINGKKIWTKGCIRSKCKGITSRNNKINWSLTI